MHLKSCQLVHVVPASRKSVSWGPARSPPRAAVCVWGSQPPPGSGPQPCAGFPSGRTSTACREQEDSRTSSSSPGGANDQEKWISPSHLVRADDRSEGALTVELQALRNLRWMVLLLGNLRAILTTCQCITEQRCNYKNTSSQEIMFWIRCWSTHPLSVLWRLGGQNYDLNGKKTHGDTSQ